MLRFQCYFILSWYGFKDAFTGKGGGWLDILSNIKANFSSFVLGLSFVIVTARVIIISLIGHRLLNDLKFNFIGIGFSYDLIPFRFC